MIRILAQNRWPWRMHATYDETISRALDVFERVNQEIPLTGLNWFFDHAETISDQSIDRIAALGGVVAVQHRMAYQGEYFVERYGHGAAEATPPVKKILEAGVKISAGTDATRAEGFGAEVKRRIMVGTYVLCHGYYDAYYIKAQKIRRLIANDFAAALNGPDAPCDVIMGPVAPSVAWDLGEKNDDPVANYLADIFTLSTSLAGLPGMSIPCGFGQGEKNAQRPVGLQIIGNYFAEAKLLGIAHQYQQVTDWHQRAPECRRDTRR